MSNCIRRFFDVGGELEWRISAVVIGCAAALASLDRKVSELSRSRIQNFGEPTDLEEKGCGIDHDINGVPVTKPT